MWKFHFLKESVFFYLHPKFQTIWTEIDLHLEAALSLGLVCIHRWTRNGRCHGVNQYALRETSHTKFIKTVLDSKTTFFF